MYNDNMKQLTPRKRKNRDGVSWAKRRNVTLPAYMVDFIVAEAEKRQMPVYELVHEGVKLYVRVHSDEGDHAKP